MISIIVRNSGKLRVVCRALFAILSIGLLFYITYLFLSLKSIVHPAGNSKDFFQPVSDMLLKGKYNVSALVFYGRRQYIKILNCYLEQNLIENGGLLSDVVFVSKTNNQADLKYLHHLVSQHPGTYFIKTDTDLNWTFHNHYRNLDLNRYYVKIDDDVLYIHPGAINSMLQTKLNNPDAIFISANVINHPNSGQMHLSLRALINTTNSLPIDSKTGLPICNWRHADCANVHHRSFLHHHQKKTLDAYVFPTWDLNAFGYHRWSINFFLFKGNEVQDVGPGDDEQQISVEIPKNQKKHSLVVGTALVAHFGYKPQRRSGLNDSAFLPDYQRIAEGVCASTLLMRLSKRSMFGVNSAP